jgi:hypothetical protein
MSSVVRRLGAGASTPDSRHLLASEETHLRHLRTRLVHTAPPLGDVMLAYQNTFDWLDLNLATESDCSKKNLS